MVDWQIFKITSEMKGSSSGRGGWFYHLELNKHVKYSDGYYKHVNMHTSSGYNNWIEIDLDRTKNIRSDDIISYDWWRAVPREVGVASVTASSMISASSVDPTALFVTQDGINRIKRGEISEFEYKMVDNSGNRHHWTYKK